MRKKDWQYSSNYAIIEIPVCRKICIAANRRSGRKNVMLLEDVITFNFRIFSLISDMMNLQPML
jgi:polyphosphate kinase